MATLRNKKKLTALNKKNSQKHPRSNLRDNSSVDRSQEDYIYQFLEKNKRRVTKKLPQEFSNMKNRLLGAISRLDDIILNSLVQGHSRTAQRRPGTNLAQTRERTRTTPRVILILKQTSSAVRQHKKLAQKLATTTSRRHFCLFKPSPKFFTFTLFQKKNSSILLVEIWNLN